MGQQRCADDGVWRKSGERCSPCRCAAATRHANTAATTPTHIEPFPSSPLSPTTAYYFFYFGAGVCLLPYVNLLVFQEAAGLGPRQIGALAALRPWVSAPASFAWSALADAKRAHRCGGKDGGDVGGGWRG